MLKYGGAVFWRLGIRPTVRKYSTAQNITVVRTEKVEINNGPDKTNINDVNGRSDLIASAFASLNDPNPPEDSNKKPSAKSTKVPHSQKVDMLIQQATNINSLLTVAETPIVSRRHALKIVSLLSEWSSVNKVKLADFEKDPRFLRLCRILARTPNNQTMNLMTRPDDLNTVLGITGDDEAARLINNLKLPQMVKVMQALAHKGRRSTSLLHALSNNIVEINEPIDLKKSADLLYSMVSLNFPNTVLMDRICNDVIQQLPLNKDKSSVVQSIMVSLGLMKYRHEPALTAISDWMIKNNEICRPQDVASAVVSLATLNFVPENGNALLQIALQIKESDLVRTASWLDLVFSLLILDKATDKHLSSILSSEFSEKLLSVGEIPISVRKKLIAMDSYVALAYKDYKGPRLAEDISVGVPIVYTKEKQVYVQNIMDTFKNFISSGNFLKRDCSSGMGFLYDGEFVVDSKCHPVPLSQASKDKNLFHIAVLGLDYHDLCRKTAVPLGICHLYTRLLELKGFKVLQIPYTEFNPRDKLITRVQYIERNLKRLVGQST